jgi:hypothetical protein
MNRRSRRFLALVLCVLLGLGLPLYTTYAAPASGDHHATMSHGEGMPECGSQDNSGSVDCAQFCGAVCAGMALPHVLSVSAVAPARQPVVVAAIFSFQSLSGPPGLQPPR